MALGFENPEKNAPWPQVDAPTLQGPTSRQVSSDETVAGQMNNILSSNSPLLQRAKTRAAQAANSRGLLNSSMGVQAGEEAVLTTAMPMAQQAAAAYNQQGLVNQNAQNQFATAANKYSTDAAMDQQRYGQNFQLAEQQYGQQVGAGTYAGQQGLIGASLQSQLALQQDKQSHDATQSRLSREQQTALQEGQQSYGAEQSALGRAQQQNLQAAEQSYGAEQSALGRAQQQTLQAAEQSYGAEQAALGREFGASESQLGREQQTALQTGQQQFAAGESALNRAQQTALQEGQQQFTAGESALNRAQQTALQDSQQAFTKSESELGRTHDVTLMTKKHAHEVSTAETLQEHTQANMNLENGLQKELINLGHEHDLTLTKTNADLEMKKISAEVAANTQGAYLNSVSELVRQTQITVGEIQMKEGISAEDKSAMMKDQGELLTAHVTAQKDLYQNAATWEQDWADLPSDSV